MTVLKTSRNKWVILLMPAVIFGLIHLQNPNVTVFSIANLVLGGVAFAYLMLKTGRIWASIGLHITWNFFLGNVFGIAVSGTENFSVMTTELQGKKWLTGGAFGIEGGAIFTLLLVLLLVFIHLFVKNPDGSGWSSESDMPLFIQTMPYTIFRRNFSLDIINIV